jgi:membrane fusion protein, multidrug efflux system
MRCTTIRCLLCFVFFTTIIACKDKKVKDSPSSAGSNNNPSINTEAYVVKPTNLTATIEAAGSLLPFEETEIRSEISGRVVGLYLREGNYVNRGALLVKLFDGDLQAQLRKLQVQLKIAEKTVERQQELLKISGISQQEVDLSELQVSNLKADMELVRVNIARTQIRAPFSGKMGLKKISNGAYITPALVLSTLRQVNQLKLSFNIPEMYSAQVHTGQTVQFSLAGSTKNYFATISATETAVEEDTRNLSVRAVVKSADNTLVPGEFAKVKIVLGENSNAIMIPTQSIVPQGRIKQVFTVKNGKAAAIEIITGTRDSSNVEVLSGLKYGDTILTSGLLFVKPGSPVTLSKVN